MEQLARQGSILLTPSTNSLVEGFVTTKSLGTTSIKGLGEALEVYDAIEATPRRTRFRAFARRELTRFVGRDAELEQLSGLRQSAMDGFGQGVFDRCWEIRSLAELGRFSEASPHEAEMFRLIERRQHYYTIGQANHYATHFRLLKGDWVLADRYIELSVDAYRAGNILLQPPQAIAQSAWCKAALGNEDEAQSRHCEAERLVQNLEDKGVTFSLELAYRCLSRTALICRQIDQARRFAHRALDFSKCDGEVAHALQLLGDINFHDDHFNAEESRDCYHRALALAEPQGMRPLIAHCHFGLGKLNRCAENIDLARRHLATATTLYREMDMEYWLEQAQAEAFKAS